MLKSTLAQADLHHMVVYEKARHTSVCWPALTEIHRGCAIFYKPLQPVIMEGEVELQKIWSKNCQLLQGHATGGIRRW